MQTSIRRALYYTLLMLFMNIVFVSHFMPHPVVAVCMGVATGLFYIYFHIAPRRDASLQRRVQILIGGRELALAAILCYTLELLLYLSMLLFGNMEPSILILNGIVCAGLLILLLLNGVIRIFTCSGQLGILLRICMLAFWWMPVVNIVMLLKFLNLSEAEYRFTLKRRRRNRHRKHAELCKTKYPLMLVHGIFFRDWKNLNYWGRIPDELMENGATVYYGNHQSTASVEQCGRELKECIEQMLRETGSEKVNILAHSKGGLDSRYAISLLGMGDRVASLTTINTPHRGCEYVGKLLDVVPEKAVTAIGRQYEALFSKLGDDNPDFFGGLQNLTIEECEKLNAIMLDDPRVYYQSVGSRLYAAKSAPFPMNVGYRLIKRYKGGDNDGLVPTKSMEWGNFLGVVSPRGKEGISHADIIDLLRKDIKGFDVCEFYVDLVNKLKLRGL